MLQLLRDFYYDIYVMTITLTHLGASHGWFSYVCVSLTYTGLYSSMLSVLINTVENKDDV